MNFVLAHIQYNPECFSKIIDDFDEYVKCAEQENFQEHFDDLENLAKIRGEEDDIIILKNISKRMERALAELKNDPARYLKDFDEIKKILVCADLEEKEDQWLKVTKLLNELLHHLRIFYNIVIEDIWKINWQSYITAQNDTGKASPRSKN